MLRDDCRRVIRSLFRERRRHELLGNDDRVLCQRHTTLSAAERSEYSISDIFDVDVSLTKVLVRDGLVLGNVRVRDDLHRPFCIDPFLGDRGLDALEERRVFDHRPLGIENTGHRCGHWTGLASQSVQLPSGDPESRLRSPYLALDGAVIDLDPKELAGTAMETDNATDGDASRHRSRLQADLPFAPSVSGEFRIEHVH